MHLSLLRLSAMCIVIRLFPIFRFSGPSSFRFSFFHPRFVFLFPFFDRLNYTRLFRFSPGIFDTIEYITADSYKKAVFRKVFSTFLLS